MTKLDRVLRRELDIGGDAYVLTLTPDTLKLTKKGRRKGQELHWRDLVSGEAALAVALNASLAAARSSRTMATPKTTPPVAAQPQGAPSPTPLRAAGSKRRRRG